MYEVVLGADEDPDHAEPAVDAITNLPGGPSEVRVTVVHCFEDHSTSTSANRAEDVPSDVSATRIEGVRAVVDRLEEAGFEPEVRESSGDPADEIVRLADEIDADLVVVGGRKRSPAGKALFGSVTQQVILNAGRPVMVTSVQ